MNMTIIYSFHAKSKWVLSYEVKISIIGKRRENATHNPTRPIQEESSGHEITEHLGIIFYEILESSTGR